MKNSAKLISVVLVAVLVFVLALAIGAQTKSEIGSGEITLNLETNLPSNEELFAGYVNSVMHPLDPSAALPQGTLAREKLNNGEKAIYDFLLDMIKDVALGDVSYATSTMTESYMDDHGIIRRYNTSDNSVAYNSFFANYNWHNVIYALTADLPYDLYWFEKTEGVYCNYYYRYTSTSVTFTSFIFKFVVSEDYKMAGGDDFTVDTSKTSAATQSYENAVAIVEQYASLDDYNKLYSYDAKIRELVDYNHDAWYDGAQQMPYGDPWQLIWVFDNDPATKVVCEGYAKAFHLLCDLSDFENDIVCVNVSGDAGGAHMWNIVKMEDGKNYLVDVTWNDSSPGRYFLKGGTGSVTGGYTTSGSYRTYRSDMYDRFGTDANSILKLSSTDYVYTQDVPDGVIDLGRCGDNLTWTLYSDGELVIEGTGAMWDYSSNYDSEKGKYVTTAPWEEYSDAMTKLTLTDSVTSIGEMAFYNCSGFTGYLVIPDSVTSIGSWAFEGCSGFTGYLVIPDSVTSIDIWAFSGCSGFTGDLVIPDSVTSIGGSAFSGCSGFTGDLVIPDSVTSIGGSAFSGCSSFTGDLVIPDSVTSIGSYAFYYCRGFTGNLVIGKGVTTIGDYAFHGCSGFTGDLVIPDSVTSIGVAAFYNCSGFTGNLVIGKDVTSIGRYAFYNCSGFTGDLVIPDSVTSIGGWAFYNCSGFTGNLVIGKDVTSIGERAFYGCSGFTGDLVIPDSVTTIGDDAFRWCGGFTGNLVVGKGVTTIGEWAFYNCSGFTGDLVIPDSVTSIGSDAFRSCSGFTGDLVIPDSVTSIGNYAFSGCSSLTKATIYTTDATFGTAIFSGTSSDFTIYGYAGSTAETYANANGHKFVALDAFTLSGALTTYLSATDDVTLSLFAPDTTEPAYTITLAGDATEYKFDAVAPGTYTMVVKKKNHVTREYELVIGEEDVTQDVKIHLIGDLDGNGRVNTRDWNAVRDHINKSAVITDSYKFACADIDGNGKVNTRDWNAIRDHINKSNPLW